ncbi:hypothetical protein ISS96_01485 [Candidatus Bathyarchaeota archaeon]|nr:hypothetical protein [Candidatus Bathyarchaeota archaeon]
MQEVTVRIEVRLGNTEDPQKVFDAVSNIAKCGEPTLLEHEYGRFLVFQGCGREFLSPLRGLLFKHRILGAARRVLKRSLRGNVFHFCLNKQAAYSAQVSFCEEEGESPLGPLVVEVTTYDTVSFLDWLTPKTGKDRSTAR